MSADELRAKGYIEGPGGWYKSKPRGTDDSGIHSGDKKRTEGKPLERLIPREATRRNRLKIRFTVYARRPGDWDGYDVKWIQDLLVEAGLLPSDDWAALQGEVCSEKVHEKDKERTEILIERIP